MKIKIDEACIKEIYGAVSGEEPHAMKIKVGAIMSSPINGRSIHFTLPTLDPTILDIMKALEENRVSINTYLEIEDEKK